MNCLCCRRQHGMMRKGEKKMRKKGMALAAVCVLSGVLVFGACGKQPEETDTKENSSGKEENDVEKTNSNGSEAERNENTSDKTENNTEKTNSNGSETENKIPQTKEERQKRLKDYADKNNLDEDQFKWLRWLDAESEFENSGTFLMDGFNKEEQAAAELLEQASGQTVWRVIQRDFDGDGRTETFALTSNLEGIAVWFAAADGTTCQVNDITFIRNSGCIELKGNTFFVHTIDGADCTSYCMYEVDGNKVKPAPIDCYFGLELTEDGKICVSSGEDDRWSPVKNYGEPAGAGFFGYTFKKYYYDYDENGFHEYSGVPVTEQEFCQYNNGAEILGAVRRGGGIVKDIYYFADGRMVVNYVEDNRKETDERKRERQRYNYYLQVPILAEGQEGFTLAWNRSLDIKALQEEGEKEKSDIFVGSGIYQPVFQEELAQYPDYESPVEYYKKIYAGLTKSDFKICSVQTPGEMPDRGEILATGEDLSGIKHNSLVFRFTDEYHAVVAEKNKELEGRASTGAGALLGLASDQNAIGVWIGEEYICSGFLQDYFDWDSVGFVGNNEKNSEEPSVYADCLVFADSERARQIGDYTAERASKIHAFAETTGLVQEETTEEIKKPGTYCAEQEYLIDLNGDGVKERLFFSKNQLLINDKNYSAFFNRSEGMDDDFFFLWDIDTSDKILEIGLWEHGASDTNYTRIYWYDGETLRPAGEIEGPWEKLYTGIVFDGAGTLTMECRLQVLQTWRAEKSFQLNEYHELTEVEQELYYVKNYREEKYPYTLLAPVRLYKAMDTTSDFVEIQSGTKIVLPATDDKNFVLVETEDGTKGYLLLDDNGYNIENSDGSFSPGAEVIDGLSFAG